MKTLIFVFCGLDPTRFQTTLPRPTQLSLSCGAVALRLEHRTINRDNPGSNHLSVSKIGQFFSLHVASVNSSV